MTLVDDISGEAAEDKQFIVVQSRNGNYFYIVIDNAAEGENKVHFLNQVDEADLLSIIESEETQQAPAVCICTDKCSVGHINTSCPVCSVNMAGCSGKEAAPQPDEQTEQPQQNDKQGSMGGLAPVSYTHLYHRDGPLLVFPDEYLTRKDQSVLELLHQNHSCLLYTSRCV